MPTRPARTAENVADSVAENVQSFVDRLVDAELTKELARRGQDMAGIVAERGSDLGERASDAWRDSRPLRRNAARRVARSSGEAAKWSRGMWRSSLLPALKDAWSRRTVAMGAAGAAVPVGRDLLGSAAVTLGLKERQRREERRRWGAFFLGLALGAIAGAIVAMLTTPRRGSEVRRELGERADVMRRELGLRADVIAARAREAEWMPVFQRATDAGNGHAVGSTTAATDAENALAGAAESGSSGGEGGTSPEAAEKAATDTAEQINEAFDVDRQPVDRVDRESPA